MEINGGDDVSGENLVNTVDKCEKWLENCSLCEDDVCSNTTETSNDSAMESGFIFKDNRLRNYDEVMCFNNGAMVDFNAVFNNTLPKIENIKICNSRKVHIGNVAHINGPIFFPENTTSINQQVNIINMEFPIISRRYWLAQPPLEQREYLGGPAKLVIIYHSATEEAFTQADNTLLVRLIQTFHIESRNWADIGYNFLIGADGSVFEGRGWDVVGAHSITYNRYSIGICFIGCYMQHLPPLVALRKAQDLIEFGIEKGKINKNYQLLGHCQCSSVESPGKVLFEEIKTWKNWNGDISVTNPSSLINNSPSK